MSPNKDANAKKAASLIAKFRTERIDNPFNEIQLMAVLKEGKCSYPKDIIKGLYKTGTMVKKADDTLAFASSDPIHYSVIKRFHDEASKRAADYQAKSKINKQDPDAKKLAAAIAFIKSKGGEVYMLVTERKKM